MDLSWEIFAALVAVAALAGFIDAIAGGGGLLTLPALLAAGVPPVSALATSKLQSSLGTASAAFAYARGGHVQFRKMGGAAATAFAGSATGGIAVQSLDPTFLQALVPVLLIAIAIYFLASPKVADQPRPARLRLLAYAGVAGAIGFYDGFFGPGTGAFLVVSMILLAGMDLVRATANTKLLNLASNLGALLVLAAGGHVIWVLGLATAAGSMTGGQLGSMAALKVGPRVIRPLLVIVSLAMTARILLQPDNPLARLIWRG